MKTSMLPARWLVIAACLLAATAHAATWKLTAGVDHTSGNYTGTNDITTTYIPVSLSYRASHIGVRATVPYVEISGPATFLDEGGQVVLGPDHTENGIGDALLAATLYDVVNLSRQRFYIDITGKIKFGTADENKGLGTGQTDYAAQLEWGKDFDRVGFFGTVGYKIYGDPPGEDLRNAGYVSVGADYRLTQRAKAGLIFDVRESAIAGEDALQELTLFAVLTSSPRFSLQPYVLAGLSDSSPDWGAGIVVAWKQRRQ